MCTNANTEVMAHSSNIVLFKNFGVRKEWKRESERRERDRMEESESVSVTQRTHLLPLAAVMMTWPGSRTSNRPRSWSQGRDVAHPLLRIQRHSLAVCCVP